MRRVSNFSRLLILLLVLLCALASPVSAAVSKNSNSVAQTEQSGTSHSNTQLTIAAGSNTVLVAFLLTSGDPGAISAATWAGVSMTAIGNANNATSGRRVYLYGLVAPTTGNQTLSFTTTNSVDTFIYAVAFDGADQSGGTTTFANFTSATGNSTQPSVAITTANGNATVDAANSPTGGWDTATTNVTSLFRKSGSGSIDGGAAYALNSGSSQTHTWTTGSAQWVIAGVSVVAVGGGGAAAPKQLMTLGVGNE